MFGSPRFVGEHLPCDLCGGAESVVLARRDRRLRPLVNVLCKGCGLIRQDPMPTEAELAAYYARTYRLDYKGASEPRKQEIARSAENAALRHRVVAPFLKAGARVLDVGSGVGSFVALMAREGFAARGLEPDAMYARWSAKHLGIDVEEGTWERARFAPGAFDLISLNHVLEHLRAPSAALRRLHEWLAPGGLLYVAVPDMQQGDASPLNRFHVAHVHGFTHETLVMLGLKTGFALEPAAARRGTLLLFRRRDAPAQDWRAFPDHAEELARFYAENTPLRFALRPAAYRRLAQHVAKQIRERTGM